jgi:hypothetical protein
MDDFLIRADDVLKHFETLNAVRPDLARIKVFSGLGHNDFNYLQHEMVRTELKKLLKKQVDLPI